MKKCLIMNKSEKYNVYTYAGSEDSRFIQLIQLFKDDFAPGKLIDFLYDDKKMFVSNDWVSIDKERGAIALYDVSASLDETYIGDYLDPLKRFEMSVKNFAEILVQWEELRVSMPNIMLLIIHEDNHVSLETDPVIIKEYQDAGYAFDSSKEPKGIEEYLLLETYQGYLDPIGNVIYSTLFSLQYYFLDIYYPNRKKICMYDTYMYHNQKENIVYIGSFDWDSIKKEIMPKKDEIASYVNKFNSCAMTYDNFIEFSHAWLTMSESGKPFGIIYRNEHDLLCCQSFDEKEEMHDFVRNYRVF